MKSGTPPAGESLVSARFTTQVAESINDPKFSFRRHLRCACVRAGSLEFLEWSFLNPVFPSVLEFKWFWRGCKPSSVCPGLLRGRESFVLAADTRNPPHFRATGSEPLQNSLFGLAPDGVFRAALLALRAVRSYRTFSPLPWGLRPKAV